MDFKKAFNDLAQKYGLKYQYQEFKNCFGGNWVVYTHSLYNNSGCFTIHCLPQRGEVDCYFASNFSNDRTALCEVLINIFDIEKDIWDKHEKIWIFKNPFCYWNLNKTIKTILEVIEASIQKSNEFAGIQIQYNIQKN